MDLECDALLTRLMMALLGIGLIAGCSSSLGGGGGEPPAKTYIVLPNGQAVTATPAPY